MRHVENKNVILSKIISYNKHKARLKGETKRLHHFYTIKTMVRYAVNKVTSSHKETMFKLVVLFALLALTSAAPAPGVLATHAVPLVHSTVIGSIPTTISHQSNSVVHSAAIVHSAPIVHAAPLVHHADLALSAAPLAFGHHGLLLH